MTLKDLIEMIKIDRIPKPSELTMAVQKDLTQQFINGQKRVWSKPYIKKSLLQMSNRKCVYCESLLGEESKYMEVEHYYPKNIYPEKVVEWPNLFASCKRCNGTKGEYDTGKLPFIHPENDTPRQHLVLKEKALLVGVDNKGKATVHKLDLNNYDLVRGPKLTIIYKIIVDLEDLYEEIYARTLQESVKFQEKVQRKMYAILKAMSPRSAYSAYVSGTILHHPEFEEIMRLMKESNIWIGIHEQLITQARHHGFEVYSD